VEPNHDHFRQIQRLEARVEASRAVVRREAEAEAPDCGRACAAAEDGCAAAEELCALAGTVDDLDARTRCERARTACVELRGRTEPPCGCDAGGGP
jgi:hypothetical protein